MSFYNIINGEKRSADRRSRGVNPSSGEALWSVPVASSDDLNEAVKAARDAFPRWSDSTVDQRKSLIATFEARIKAEQDDLINLLKAEGGKPHGLALSELNFAFRWFNFHLALDMDGEKEVLADRTIETHYTPLGVVAAICPWNFPLVLSLGKILPALLTGCCVVVKPSPFTPYATLRMVELAVDIFPPGVLQVLNGDDSLGPTMVAHPDIAKISFTGSVATGMKIMEKSAPTLKRITLELGGNDAAVVCPDVDIESVAKQILSSALMNAGQMCVATKRVYVHHTIYDEFMLAATRALNEFALGSTESQGSSLGPIQNKPQYDRVMSLLQDSKEKGHVLHIGQEAAENLRNGLFIRPTIVDSPSDSSRVVSEEAFGPILPILKWTDVKDLLARVNATQTGLGASVWSANAETANAIAQKLEVGSVWINMIEIPIPEAYFTGHKHSAIGGEWGNNGWKAFCNAQVVHTPLPRKGRL